MNAKGDDASIVFRYVRNFVGTGEFAYNPGEPTFGFTSLAWFFFLSIRYAIFRDIYHAVFAAGLFSRFLFAAAMRLIAVRILKTETFRMLLLFSILCGCWISRWSFSGQEITFKIAVCGFVIVYASEFLSGTRRNNDLSCVSLGLLLSFALFTRPEFLLLNGIVTSLLQLKKDFRTDVIAGSTVIAVYGSWAIFCYFHFGWFIPHTVFVKAGSSYG